METCFPDYSNTGLTVVSAVLNAFGVKDEHAQQKDVKELMEKHAYKKAILMLFDGMGMDILEHALPEDSFLRTHIVSEMSAAYPSTTACATTSIACCETPREHGWIGWDLYFKEEDKLVAVLINVDEETGEQAAPYHLGRKYAPFTPVCRRLNESGVGGHDISAFGTDIIHDLDGMREIILSLCADDKKRYMYCYWGDPDHTMHERGCYDEKVLQIVRDIDRYIEDLAASLPEDVLLMVTADHGLIDGEWVYLEEHRELTGMLLKRPSVEPRACAFYLKDEYKEAFPKLFNSLYGEHFRLLTAKEFVEGGYLGGGKDHPKLYDFIGDYIALSLDKTCISLLPKDGTLIGMHAGLTRQEMKVPLIVAKK
ncbi:MAG: hypothetical protein CW338_05295 [Clostridiales bacterium]|nr:hypothetical protein [Clostridiales bacterium]